MIFVAGAHDTGAPEVFAVTYEVSCTHCDLDQEMEDVDAVLDLEDEHQARHGESHVLEFELVH